MRIRFITSIDPRINSADVPEVPSRKAVPAVPAPVMALLAEAGERLSGLKLKASTREEIEALFKKKAA